MNSRRRNWTTYGLMVSVGYVIYSVGYLTPYLESELGAPTWASALPNSAVAVGFLVAGVVAKPAIRRLGAGGAARLWAVLVAVAACLIASAASLAVVLAGACLFGIAAAGVMVHAVNAFGALANGRYLVRANVWSILGSLAGPLAISAAARSIGWNLGVLLPVPLVLLLAFLIPASPAADAAAKDGHLEPRLSRPYWMTWAYLALCIGAEFSYVAWGAQVTVARSGITLADATALASLFVAGELLGRVVFSTRVAEVVDRTMTLRASTLLTAVGGLVLWLAPGTAGAAVGLFLGGLGMAAIYPVGASVAMAHAPGAQVRASARLTTASGISIFTAPLLLGVVASAAGVFTAWALVVGLLVTAFLVLLAIPRPPAVPVSEVVPVVSPGP